jgi:MOSC domain-containing protein YiiM
VDGTTPETCGECGFDSRSWRVSDARTLFDALGYWWRLATAGLSDVDLNRRPTPGVWSAMEYGLHTSFVTAVIRSGLELILDRDGSALPAVPALPAGAKDHSLTLEPAEVLAALEREGAALAAMADGRSTGWANIGHLPDGTVIQAEAALFHATHDASHHFFDVSRGLAAIDAGPAAERAGVVAQINISNGGVPKLPVTESLVGWRGIQGDHQADRKHHGRPFQAVCLWSSEVIDEFAGAGHPIAAGAAGENFTVSGLNWSALRAGTRLRVGTTTVELSYPAVPCQKQAKWFADGDFSRISHDRFPQWARWYGWVREPGSVQVGDAVVVGPGRPRTGTGNGNGNGNG